jgi:hypothetical protein
MMRLALFCALLATAGVVADDHNHSYKKGEEVTLWANKVGPYHNPQETYDWDSMPFCRPKVRLQLPPPPPPPLSYFTHTAEHQQNLSPTLQINAVCSPRARSHARRCINPLAHTYTHTPPHEHTTTHKPSPLCCCAAHTAPSVITCAASRQRR